MTDSNKTIERRLREVRNTWMIKSKPEVKKKLDEIRVARVKKGLDIKMKSYSEIIEAGLRYDPLIDILKKAEFKGGLQ